MQSIEINSVDELYSVAEKILSSSPDQNIFALYGEMGAGKTNLIKAFCQVLGVEQEVSSPTFSLINEYYSPESGIIYHFDFYRTESIEEVFDIGYEDYFFSGNYCFLEWPERISKLLPENFVYLSIKITGAEQRLISWQSM
ncbi:MAG: tRNA (adenosine(37)-N6)-threonylcarbamoyltransferase complex ATPase subunit type 1 TsaE [Bacteroidales bacterium]|nr:tRNA (adenosine(37)-N6)-threonylcarbamoyltransferase complex ATPase subunit type 1 TsaE [Bacteroidales bacterium]MCF8327532.1 tRNA (adenosine(37)-N6)-threonylcarbamoyltransferase complex ATPase subunit type 1 TsaE [Bacteroidales bacterium]